MKTTQAARRQKRQQQKLARKRQRWQRQTLPRRLRQRRRDWRGAVEYMFSVEQRMQDFRQLYVRQNLQPVCYVNGTLCTYLDFCEHVCCFARALGLAVVWPDAYHLKTALREDATAGLDRALDWLNYLERRPGFRWVVENHSLHLFGKPTSACIVSDVENQQIG